MPASALISAPGYVALGPDDEGDSSSSSSDSSHFPQHPIIPREARPGIPRGEPVSYTSLSDMIEDNKALQRSKPKHPAAPEPAHLIHQQPPLLPTPSAAQPQDGSTLDPEPSSQPPLHRIASNGSTNSGSRSRNQSPRVSPLSPSSVSSPGLHTANTNKRRRPRATRSRSHGSAAPPDLLRRRSSQHSSSSHLYRAFVLNGLDLKRLQNALADADIDLRSQQTYPSDVSIEFDHGKVEDDLFSTIHTRRWSGTTEATEIDEDEHYELVVRNLSGDHDDDDSDSLPEQESSKIAADLAEARRQLALAQTKAAEALCREEVSRQRAVRGIRQERRARLRAEQEAKKISRELVRLQARVAKEALSTSHTTEPSTDDDVSVFSVISSRTHESYDTTGTSDDEDVEDAFRWTAAQALAREEVEEELGSEREAHLHAKQEAERLRRDLARIHREWAATRAAAQEQARLHGERLEAERKRTREEADRRAAEARARALAEERLETEREARIELEQEAQRSFEDLSRIEAEWAASRAAAGEDVRSHAVSLLAIEKLLEEENSRRTKEEQARKEAEAREHQVQQARIQAESDARKITEELARVQEAWEEQRRGAHERATSLRAELDAERQRMENTEAARKQAEERIQKEAADRREAELEKADLVAEVRRVETELEAHHRAGENARAEVARLRELLLKEETRRSQAETEAECAADLRRELDAERRRTERHRAARERAESELEAHRRAGENVHAGVAEFRELLRKEEARRLEAQTRAKTVAGLQTERKAELRTSLPTEISATNHPSKMQSRTSLSFLLHSVWRIPVTTFSALVGLRSYTEEESISTQGEDDDTAETQEEEEDEPAYSLLRMFRNKGGRLTHLVPGESGDGNGTLGIFRHNSVRIAQVCLAMAYFTGVRVGFGFGSDSNTFLGGIGFGGSWFQSKSFSLPLRSFSMR